MQNATEVRPEETTAIVVQKVDTEGLKSKGAIALESAKVLVIDSDTMYELAAEELGTVKTTLVQLETMREAVSKPLFQAQKANNDNFKVIKAPWEQAESTLKTAMLGWVEKKEAEAEAARKQAEADAAAARKEAEEREAEARKQAEAALEKAAGAGTEEAQVEAMAQAEQAEAQAESFALEAAIVAAAPVFVPRPSAVGTQLRGTWKATVEDKLALIRHIAANAEANPDLLLLVDIDAASLNRRAKALERNLNLPGVKPVFERSIAARSN